MQMFWLYYGLCSNIKSIYYEDSHVFGQLAFLSYPSKFGKGTSSLWYRTKIVCVVMYHSYIRYAG